MFFQQVSLDTDRRRLYFPEKSSAGVPGRWPAFSGLFHVSQYNTILEESAFRAELETEKRRLDRSGRPFLVVRITAPALLGIASNHRSRRRALRALWAMCRQTDIVGWIETGKVLGVIFTELGNYLPAPAGDVISDRIKAVVQRELASRSTAVPLSVEAYCRVAAEPISSGRAQSGVAC